MSLENSRSLYLTQRRFANLVDLLTAHAINEDFTIEELELAVEAVRHEVSVYKLRNPEWLPPIVPSETLATALGLGPKRRKE